jgi:hypothetical protein
VYTNASAKEDAQHFFPFKFFIKTDRMELITYGDFSTMSLLKTQHESDSSCKLEKLQNLTRRLPTNVM